MKHMAVCGSGLCKREPLYDVWLSLYLTLLVFLYIHSASSLFQNALLLCTCLGNVNMLVPTGVASIHCFKQLMVC